MPGTSADLLSVGRMRGLFVRGLRDLSRSGAGRRHDCRHGKPDGSLYWRGIRVIPRLGQRFGGRRCGRGRGDPMADWCM